VSSLKQVISLGDCAGEKQPLCFRGSSWTSGRITEADPQFWTQRLCTDPVALGGGNKRPKRFDSPSPHPQGDQNACHGTLMGHHPDPRRLDQRDKHGLSAQRADLSGVCLRREFAESSEVVNLAAMDGRKAQVRQYISDLRSSINQPDAIPRSFRGMASAIRVEASVCQDPCRKGPEREGQSSTGAIQTECDQMASGGRIGGDIVSGPKLVPMLLI
jgi:hypothetical protein